MKISTFDVIKVSLGVIITKIVWDASEVLKLYLTNEENLYKISRSIEYDNADESPEETKEVISKTDTKNNEKLDKIGF